MKNFIYIPLLCVLLGCQPKALDELQNAASALKSIVVDESAQMAGGNKTVVLIAPKAFGGAILKLGDDFKSVFEKKGLKVLEVIRVDVGDPMHYTTYGWKGSDYTDTLQKYPNAGAIVSLVGTPLPGTLPAMPHPPVVAIAVRQIGVAPGIPSNPNIVNQMLASKTVQLAIIDGAGTTLNKTDKTSKLFNENFQILRAAP